MAIQPNRLKCYLACYRRAYLHLPFVFLLFSITLQAGPSADPSDLFLQAYQEFQNAERLEHQNLPNKALDKYHYTENALTQLRKTNSDWQPSVVNYRLRKTQENIVRLERLPLSCFNGSAFPQGMNTRSSASMPSLTITPPAENLNPPLSGPHLSLSQYEIRRLRWQLEQAAHDNQRLGEAAAKAEAEKKSALIEIDKIKVSLIESKSQNSDIQSTANIMREKNNRIVRLQEAYKNQLASLQEQIQTLAADNNVLAEENERLLKKVENAAAYIQDSDKIRENLIQDRQRLYKAETATRKKLNQIQDNTKLVKELKIANKNSLTKISELSQELTNSQTQLNQSKEYIQKLQKGELGQLQSQLNSANQELLKSQDSTNQSNKHIADLENQLKNTSETLAQFKSSENEDLHRQEEENEILREIILRVMKEEMQRPQAFQFIEEELKPLHIKPNTFFQPAIFEKPIIRLTEKEKKLFIPPILLIANEHNPSSLNATVALVKKTTTRSLNTQAPPPNTFTAEKKPLAGLPAPAFFSPHNYLNIRETGSLNPNDATAHFNLSVLYSTQKFPNKELARKHYLLSTQLGATPDVILERLIQ